MVCKKSPLPENVVELEGPSRITAENTMSTIEVNQSEFKYIDPLKTYLNEPEPEPKGSTFFECLAEIEDKIPAFGELVRFSVDEVLSYQFSETDGFNFDSRLENHETAAAKEQNLIVEAVAQIQEFLPSADLRYLEQELRDRINKLKTNLLLVSKRYELKIKEHYNPEDEVRTPRFSHEKTAPLPLSEKLEDSPVELSNPKDIELRARAEEAHDLLRSYTNMIIDNVAERDALRAIEKRKVVLSRFSEGNRFNGPTGLLTFYFSGRCKDVIEDVLSA